MIQEISYFNTNAQKKMPFFIGFFVFINIITLRLTSFDLPGIGLGITEPVFLLCFLLFIMHVFDLRKVFKSPISSIILIFFMYGVFNCIISSMVFHNENALSAFRKLYIYPFTFFLGYYYIKNFNILKNLHAVIKIAILCLLPLSVVFFAIGMNGTNSYFQYFIHFEGWVAAYLIYYLASKYYIDKKSISKQDKWLGFCTILMVILTNRRGIWFSVIIVMFFTYYLSAKKISSFYLLRIGLFGLLLLGGILVFVKFSEGSNNVIIKSVNDRIIQTWNSFEDPTDMDEGGSVAWRLNVYSQSFNYISQSPIIGKGVGFQPTFYIPRENGDTKEVDNRLFHDIYIQYCATTGFVGLILFLLFHGIFIAKVFSSKKVINNRVKPYVMGLFGIYMSGMIWGLAANNLISCPNFIYIMYFSMGVITRQIKELRNEKNQSNFYNLPASSII